MFHKQALLTVTSFEDGSSLPGLRHPGLVSAEGAPRQREPAGASGAPSPLLPHRGLVPGCFATLHPLQPARRGCVRTVSQPLPQVPEKTGEQFVRCAQEEGTAREAEAGRAAVRAAGHFLGTVTKARDCSEGDPQDRAELPAAVWGLSLRLSGFPRHREPRTGQSALPANDQVGNAQPLSLSRPTDGSPRAFGGSRDAGAAQDKTQEAACNFPLYSRERKKQRPERPMLK